MVFEEETPKTWILVFFEKLLKHSKARFPIFFGKTCFFKILNCYKIYFGRKLKPKTSLKTTTIQGHSFFNIEFSNLLEKTRLRRRVIVRPSTGRKMHLLRWNILPCGWFQSPWSSLECKNKKNKKQ